MQLLRPITVDTRAPLARANPVAKLAAASVLLVALFLSLDGVTAAVILLGLVTLIRWSGLDPRALLIRSWLIGLAAISIGVFNVLFAAEQLGPIVLELGPVRIGAETLVNGIGLMIRLVAIALAGILATATTEPSDLADALIQQLHVSPRFAIGPLAALRLVPLLARERETIALARRARGVDAGRNPVVAIRLAGGQLVALLVGAVRRGSRMALAMDARGFGALPSRTVARVQRMRPADWGWIAGAFALAAVAIGVSQALGTWRPLFG
ncbi:MAG TPA: energy-coupling factor transporter transmembrane component T [Candidatus Limnocylindria bacterium]|nr:energy-coupling factor transporter transmembrane component T [Candidatus Limnocylindria bacterium]